jgi:hypothetical protein
MLLQTQWTEKLLGDECYTISTAVYAPPPPPHCSYLYLLPHHQQYTRPISTSVRREVIQSSLFCSRSCTSTYGVLVVRQLQCASRSGVITAPNIHRVSSSHQHRGCVRFRKREFASPQRLRDSRSDGNSDARTSVVLVFVLLFVTTCQPVIDEKFPWGTFRDTEAASVSSLL